MNTNYFMLSFIYTSLIEDCKGKMKASALSIFVFLIICQTTFSALDCPTLYHGIKGHSACLPKSSLFIKGGVSKSEIKTILDEHNKYRAAVNPPACDMLKLYWHDDMAFVAQRWARNCDYNHDKQLNRSIPGSFSTGQNLGHAPTSPLGKMPWQMIIRAWQRETSKFTYDSASNVYTSVGHYVQLVWETTQVIGCGYAECKGFELFVCNYGPGVNYLKRNRPYEKCATASPLKDCKGKFCKNDGLYKKGTCECECPPKFTHVYGPDCSTNCSYKDSSRCKKKSSCTFFNVPPDCPWLCGTCPYLDQGKSGSTAGPTSPGNVGNGGNDGSGSGDGSSNDKANKTNGDNGDNKTNGDNGGAAASKYSEMPVLLLLLIFISNQLLQ